MQQQQERRRQQGQQQGARLSDILIPSAAETARESLARYDTQCKQLEQRQGQDDTALLQMYARSLRLAAETYESLSEAGAGAGADTDAEAPIAATGMSSGSSATSSSSSSSSGGSTGTGVDDDGTIVEKEARYRDVMLPLQYDDITYDGAVGAVNYLYHAEAAKDNSNTFVKARTKALVLTHQTLEEEGTLPLSLSSSIWVRTLNSRMDCVKVMISGPQNTPYENGLFLFDVFFPVDFPGKPPRFSSLPQAEALCALIPTCTRKARCVCRY